MVKLTPEEREVLATVLKMMEDGEKVDYVCHAANKLQGYPMDYKTALCYKLHETLGAYSLPGAICLYLIRYEGVDGWLVENEHCREARMAWLRRLVQNDTDFRKFCVDVAMDVYRRANEDRHR